MSTLKRITAAALCTAGLTAAALATATPAMAAPGVANYNCGSLYPSVDSEFDRSGSTLVVTAALSFTVPSGGATITSTLNGSTGPSATLPAGNYSEVVLTGPFATLSAAPSTFNLSVAVTGGTVPINCALSSDGGGWPV